MSEYSKIEAVFRSTYRPLCLYALHYLGDTGEAEDVVMGAFEALWGKMRGDGVYRNAVVDADDASGAAGTVANPRAWLYTAVRNASIDIVRKRRATQFVDVAALSDSGSVMESSESAEYSNSSDDVQPRDLDGYISDEEARGRSVVEARLWSAIDAMPQRRREIFLMAKRDGLSYADIASSLGISESTVRNTMEAALKSLRGQRREILGFVLCL